MRIAMIGQKGIPATGGGVERHVEEIAKRLVKMGHEVTVFCRDNYSEKKETEFEGIKLKYAYAPSKKNLEAIVYSKIASIKAIFQNFDIIHYHAIGPATMSFLPRIFFKKVVVTVHGLDWQRAKWGKLAKCYLKFGEFASIKFPNTTIVVSDTLKKYYKENYNLPSCYIPNGVLENPLEDELEIKNLGLEKDKYILFVARLTPEKGCHYLINAYKQLNTDKKLVIAGGSSNTEDYVEKLKELKGGNENIIFTGNVSGRLWRELYSSAYIYVLPSEIEGLPISLLEAMSFEKCSLVSDIPENLDVIKSEGIEKYGISFVNKCRFAS